MVYLYNAPYIIVALGTKAPKRGGSIRRPDRLDPLRPTKRTTKAYRASKGLSSFLPAGIESPTNPRSL